MSGGCCHDLAAIWLLDAVLQYQSFMSARRSARCSRDRAGQPGRIASPITWDARLIEHHGVAINTIFATIQLLLAWASPGGRRCGRPGRLDRLGLGVWWFGEGLGEALTPVASPVNGAPGAVIIYALLAVLLWPSDRHAATAPFTAARAVGVAGRPGRRWLVLWASLAYFALLPGNRTAQGLSGMIRGMASGEPAGWPPSTITPRLCWRTEGWPPPSCWRLPGW